MTTHAADTMFFSEKHGIGYPRLRRNRGAAPGEHAGDTRRFVPHRGSAPVSTKSTVADSKIRSENEFWCWIRDLRSVNEFWCRISEFFANIFFNSKYYYIFAIAKQKNHINSSNITKMSYYRHLYHIVFRTYKSDYAINEAYEQELYEFIWAYCKDNNHHLHRIGGMPDHLHILVEIRPETSVSTFVQVVKQTSSVMLKQNPHFPLFRGWQKGFASFSYCKSELNTVKNYITNQKNHHKQKSFVEEVKQMFDDNDIPYNQYIEENI